MKKVIVTIADIKNIKALMNEVDNIKDDSRTINEDGYGYNYQGKEALIEAKENEIEKNVAICANLIGVDYNTMIDMCYDFEFAEEVLSDIYKLAA